LFFGLIPARLKPCPDTKRIFETRSKGLIDWLSRTSPLTARLLLNRLQPASGGTMHLILFFLFAGFCLAGAVNLLLQTHPINSALSLIVVMTSLAVLYLLLGAEFLAAAQIIVYSGAIMVLFTFVVMLLNAGREERTLGSRAARIVGFPAVAALLAVLATVILRAQGLSAAAVNQGITSTQELSRVLFHELLLPFEVTSVLILIAILGAVVLARRDPEEPAEDRERTAAQ
jgi:NADH-quinone oxidoreductase subunit J